MSLIYLTRRDFKVLLNNHGVIHTYCVHSGNSPRINAPCTSFSWFTLNLHITGMYIFYLQQRGDRLDKIQKMAYLMLT
jgi:hypothetical protein